MLPDSTSRQLIPEQALRVATLVVFCSCLSSLGLTRTTDAQDKPIDFSHQILPLLKKHCAKCHTDGTYKGGLSFDTKAALLKSGMVEVGDADASELIVRITSTDKDERMPPEGEPLADKEVDLLKKWIETGVAWEAGFTFKTQTWKAPIRPRKPLLPRTTENPIDYLVGQYFARKKISWPKPVDDSTFLRRAMIDLIGLLPTRTELKQFKSNLAKDKRQKLIDRILGRKRDYADHWLTFWNDHLRNDYVGTGYIDGGRKQITGWLYQSLYDNKPYDQFARELIAPRPDSEGFIKGIKWRGNVNASQVRELQFAQNISQVFLGENLKCASCHDSFINDWKLEDAYGLAAILSDKPLEMYHCDKPTGRSMRPKFLWPELGEIDATAKREDRLRQTADLITNKENGRFARTIVNRIWKRMMGRGLVEPVDIMGNRPWDEDILDFLAVHLQENQFDLKKTMSLIANSRIYQAASQPQQELADNDFIFRGPMIRRLTAEQFLDAVFQVTSTTAPGRKGPIPNLASKAKPDQPSSTQKPLSKWIWNQADSTAAAGNAEINFQTTMVLEKFPAQVSAVVTCDNEYTLFVNGTKVHNDGDWNTVELISIGRFMKSGKNSLQVVGKNHTNSPNPAALYISVFVNRSFRNVKWTTRIEDKTVPAPAVTHQQIWNRIDGVIAAKELEATRKTSVSSYETLGVRPKVRASNVIADSLMRSLGRPNREQIVTTRDDQLSTLQALDLSNGQVFAGILNKGAQKILNRFDSPQEIVLHVFETAFSRKPSPSELKVLLEIVGKSPDSQSVEDLLWAIVMLPEFQHVR